MKTIGGFEFPENAEEAFLWRQTHRVRALDHNVLCVAETRVEGTWRAYVASVSGKNHEKEWQEVAHVGTTLMPTVAKVIFPEFADIPYAR